MRDTMSQIALQEPLTDKELEVITVAEQVEEMASKGLTMEQIASCVCMGTRTLYDWKDRHPQISQAIKRGRAAGIKAVSNALYDNAVNGNLGAQCFYLKNRGEPGQWQDRQDVVIDTKTQWVINAAPMTEDEWAKQNGIDNSDEDQQLIEDSSTD